MSEQNASSNSLRFIKLNFLFRKYVDVICLLLVLGAFVIDIYSPLGITGGIPYVIVIFVSLWASKNRYITLFALLATFLATYSALYGGKDTAFFNDLVNRFLIFFAIWTTTFLGVRRKNIEMALEGANEDLKKVIATDQLTGLYNRQGLEKNLKILGRLSERTGNPIHVLLIDLDNFKYINDNFGYMTGDAMLQKVSDGIRHTLRGSDIIGRVGGDEFIVLLPDTHRAEAVVAAQRLRLAISQLYMGVSGDEHLSVTASIGLTELNGSSDSLQEVMELTYHALKQSKALGKNTITSIGDSATHTDENAAAVFSKFIGKNFEDIQIQVMKQPIMNLREGKVVGFELLSRFQGTKLTMPNDFFRMAMEARTLTIVDRACLKANIAASILLPGNHQVHLNLFPSTIMEVATQDLIQDILRHQVNLKYCLEISEQQIIGEPSQLVSAVREFKKAGIFIALDDVGFGNSSLESLVLLEPDLVKVDRKCIDGVAMHVEKQRSLKRLLKVIESCDAVVCAEGIETQDDMRFLLDHGVQLGQGFLFSKPVPVH
jgi:diguanylate cyclase (GGDEF)-like protein